jgi:Protein of unknown function (DUF1778)
MDMETRSTDAKGRICLPKAFANATVIIDQLSDTELRIRKAVILPQDDVRFDEETATPLTDRDRDRFIKLLDHPPKANAALRRAAARNPRRHG